MAVVYKAIVSFSKVPLQRMNVVLISTIPVQMRCHSFFQRLAVDRSYHVSRGHILTRELHTGCQTCGLEEFFPKTENIIEESEKTGRAWLARELRNKSNDDLHKLWYVLLKERNMLLTLKYEANRQGFIMPAPERLKKVRQSMARIKLVIGEREKAIEKAKKLLKQREQVERVQEIDIEQEEQEAVVTR